jgi:ubiquinone/menaquinone biosynthesis C-methylase UbiE
MKQEKVWDTIAGDWNEFRKNPVEEVVDFLEGREGKVLDLGCGSGRNFSNIDDLDFYGVDFSEELLKFAREKGYVELKKGEVGDIDYGDGFFDYVICARVLHCVEGIDKRKKALCEIYRVLKNGGEALISVWGKQDRVKNKGKEFYLPWGDVERYTYIYDKDELVRVLEEVGFKILEVSEGDNLIARVLKGSS